LPEKIETLEIRLADLQQQCADPDFYRQDEQTIKKSQKQLADTESELQAAFKRWESLDQ